MATAVELGVASTFSDELDFVEKDIIISSDDNEGESGDEYDKEFRIYQRQVRESGGFHVDKRPPGTTLFGGIKPLEIEHKDLFERIKKFAEMAIQDYNKKQNANLEFENLVKANAEHVRGTRYYITFVAKNPSGETSKYQALVWDGIWEKEVEFCRPEPQGDPKKSRLHVTHGV